MQERRREPRRNTRIGVKVYATDKEGLPFGQEAVASNFSCRGALLTNLEREVRPGDLMIVFYEEKFARFRVVWALYADEIRQNQVAVQRVESDKCPWAALLEKETNAAADGAAAASAPNL
jgi:hypothetical protein